MYLDYLYGIYDCDLFIFIVYKHLVIMENIFLNLIIVHEI